MLAIVFADIFSTVGQFLYDNLIPASKLDTVIPLLEEEERQDFVFYQTYAYLASRRQEDSM